MAKDIVSIDIQGHGHYESTRARVEAAAKLGKPRLVARIVDAYVDGEKQYRTKAYWNRYGVASLAIIYAGIYHPTA